MKTVNLMRNQSADLQGNKDPNRKTDKINFLTLSKSADVISKRLKIFGLGEVDIQSKPVLANDLQSVCFGMGIKYQCLGYGSGYAMKVHDDGAVM